MSIDMTIWGWDERWESVLRGMAAEGPTGGLVAGATAGSSAGSLVPGG